jgi:hypothetical protein
MRLLKVILHVRHRLQHHRSQRLSRNHPLSLLNSSLKRGIQISHHLTVKPDPPVPRLLRHHPNLVADTRSARTPSSKIEESLKEVSGLGIGHFHKQYFKGNGAHTSTTPTEKHLPTLPKPPHTKHCGPLGCVLWGFGFVPQVYYGLGWVVHI